MADLSQAERDKLPEEDFAGPDRTYYITDQDDVDSAAHLIGKAADPDAVKAKVIAIAKRKGLKVPDAWAEGDGNGKDRAVTPTVTRNEDGVDSIFFLPITRIDQDKREVEGVATSEAVDTFGTVFDYEASKAAFQAWAGNVREMHQPKAVGRKVDVRFDDAEKKIVVRTRISRGAEDTWQKILDGTLSGYSIGGKGAVWARSAEAPPRCTKYDLVELSIVDQASNPDGRGLTLYRADAAEQPPILADLEAAESVTVAQPEETREGKTISAATREKLHGMRDAALGAANSAMDACGCDDCAGMRAKPDDADGDGDDDRLTREEFTRALDGALAPLRRELALARVAAVSRAPQAPDLTRFDPIPGKLDEVLRAVAAAEGRLAKIEAQPSPGGPAVRAMAEHAGLTPAEKLLGGAPRRAATNGDEIAALERLAAAHPGDQAIQTAVAARILSVQRGA